jgi:hypothetical protein
MRQKRILWVAVIVFFITGYYISIKLPEPLTDSFVGTYTSDAIIPSNIIAIDPYTGNYFYYTDSGNNYFIKGRFEEQSENVYYISCSSSKSREIIPDQEIINMGRSFIMTINGQQIAFRKTNQVPILYGDENNYK